MVNNIHNRNLLTSVLRVVLSVVIVSLLAYPGISSGDGGARTIPASAGPAGGSGVPDGGTVNASCSTESNRLSGFVRFSQ